MNPNTILSKLPDFSNWESVKYWLQMGLQVMQTSNTERSNPLEDLVCIDWKDIQAHPDSLVGLYSSLSWQRFVLSVFLADLVSYPVLSDQVNFERLLFVMHSFPAGFRVWFVKYSDGNWWPAGYSGWYPISETSFELLEKYPYKIRDRLVAPIADNPAQDPFLYLFNYSVHSSFKKTKLSKQLMSSFSQDLAKRPYKGLCAITVSGDGESVARRFGMSWTGDIPHENAVEKIYTCRT